MKVKTIDNARRICRGYPSIPLSEVAKLSEEQWTTLLEGLRSVTDSVKQTEIALTDLLNIAKDGK